jgi:hypothetical protein
MSGEVSVVALVRGEEQYIFMFDEANRTETLRMLGRYAADPDLSFTWYDAAILSQRIRELMPAASMGSNAPASNSTPKANWVQKKGNHPNSSHSLPVPTNQPRFRLPTEGS